jgi:hypothetical protein
MIPVTYWADTPEMVRAAASSALTIEWGRYFFIRETVGRDREPSAAGDIYVQIISMPWCEQISRLVRFLDRVRVVSV